MFALILFGLSLIHGLPAAQMPVSISTPQIGQKALDFTLPDLDGKHVNLAEFIAAPKKTKTASVKANWVVLIFYRGYW